MRVACVLVTHLRAKVEMGRQPHLKDRVRPGRRPLQGSAPGR